MKGCLTKYRKTFTNKWLGITNATANASIQGIRVAGGLNQIETQQNHMLGPSQSPDLSPVDHLQEIADLC